MQTKCKKILGFGKRLRQAREAQNLTRTQVVEILEIALSTLQAWENDEREPTVSYLVALCELLSISSDYLLYGQESAQGLNEEFIGIQDTKLTEAGLITKNYHFRKDWINKTTKNPTGLSIYRPKDESMNPVINKGDMVLLETFSHRKDNTIKTGLSALDGLLDGLYVVRINDRLTIRNVEFSPTGNILISPANPTFNSFSLNRGEFDPSNIVGKVIWYCREV